MRVPSSVIAADRSSSSAMPVVGRRLTGAVSAEGDAPDVADPRSAGSGVWPATSPRPPRRRRWLRPPTPSQIRSRHDPVMTLRTRLADPDDESRTGRRRPQRHRRNQVAIDVPFVEHAPYGYPHDRVSDRRADPIHEVSVAVVESKVVARIDRPVEQFEINRFRRRDATGDDRGFALQLEQIVVPDRAAHRQRRRHEEPDDSRAATATIVNRIRRLIRQLRRRAGIQRREW